MADNNQDLASGATALSDIANPAAQSNDHQSEQDDDHIESDESGDSDNEESSDKPKKKRSGNNYAKKLARTRAELDQLKSRLAVMESKPAGNAVDANKRPVLEHFKNYDEYVEALTDWKADQATDRKLSEREKKDKEVKRSESLKQRNESYAKKAEEAKTRYADFDDALAEHDDIEVRNTVLEAILDADNGPDIAYYIAKNPDIIEELNGMSDSAVYRKIGQLEERLGREGTGKAAENRASKAPPPITPVSAKKNSSSFNSKTATLEDYHAARKKGLI